MEKKYKGILRHSIYTIFRYLFMASVILISVYPILWVFLSSFKKVPGGIGLPTEWDFDGYVTIFQKLNIFVYFKNSVMIAVLSTLFSVTFVAMAAYLCARIEFKAKKLIVLMFASTLYIPSIAIGFPIYRFIDKLGLYDTRTGVIFIYSGLGIAITFFILLSYFMSIPKEMEEAAQIDGCGYYKTYIQVILPLAKPGIATAAILTFLNNWNEFYFASLILQTKCNMTIPALLGQFKTAYALDVSGMLSAIIISVLPTIILFCATSNLFVKSLVAGAVKG